MVSQVSAARAEFRTVSGTGSTSVEDVAHLGEQPPVGRVEVSV